MKTMSAHACDSVLIEQVVHLASLARAATGQCQIYDIPKGTTSSMLCPIARALNLNCSVGRSQITFPTQRQARAVAQAIGLSANRDTVPLPSQHPFSVFVARFDHGGSKQLRQLRLS